MDASQEDLQKAQSKLGDYKQKVDAGELLIPEEDYLELDVEDGRIWLHPHQDGSTVDIYLFDDTEDHDFMPARSQILHHLNRELGFNGVFTPFMANERMTLRVDYENPGKYY